MQVRRATCNDLLEIMRIIEQGRESLRLAGIPQWQDGYPNKDVITADNEHENSYVLDMDGKILGTTALVFGEDLNYKRIFEGTWLTAEPYGAIHRIAVDSDRKGQGLAKILVQATEEICKARGVFSLRVDTHKDNKAMQKMLERSGFTYCGVIYLADGSPRLAYEKVLR
jgi:ribosomal protein S18 acetylase RimI-like enzyme